MYNVIFCGIFKDLSPKKEIKRPLGLPSNTSQSQAGPTSPLTCIHLNSFHLLDTDAHSSVVPSFGTVGLARRAAAGNPRHARAAAGHRWRLASGEAASSLQRLSRHARPGQAQGCSGAGAQPVAECIWTGQRRRSTQHRLSSTQVQFLASCLLKS